MTTLRNWRHDGCLVVRFDALGIGETDPAFIGWVAGGAVAVTSQAEIAHLAWLDLVASSVASAAVEVRWMVGGTGRRFLVFGRHGG